MPEFVGLMDPTVTANSPAFFPADKVAAFAALGFLWAVVLRK
jgi:hypothetical protein